MVDSDNQTLQLPSEYRLLISNMQIKQGIETFIRYTKNGKLQYL
jgi:hypothetical protein